jgi:hypothetical protein
MMISEENERVKNAEILALAESWGKAHGGSMSLPKQGVAKLVLENCPTWREQQVWRCLRSLSYTLGMRVRRLHIPLVKGNADE